MFKYGYTFEEGEDTSNVLTKEEKDLKKKRKKEPKAKDDTSTVKHTIR